MQPASYREEIGIPEWVPARVAEAASAIVNLCDELPAQVLEFVMRLLTDPRMEDVWHELNRHKRVSYKSTGEHFRQGVLPEVLKSFDALAEAARERAQEFESFEAREAARDYVRLAEALGRAHQNSPAADPACKDEHEVALATVFVMAVALWAQPRRVVPQREIADHIGVLRKAGRHAVADTHAKAMLEPDNRPWIVERERTDPFVRGFVIELAACMKMLFGSSLYGVVSTITNVVFNQELVSRAQIRALLKGRDGKVSAS